MKYSREQFVSVDEIESSKKHLPYRVPQASVLRPLHRALPFHLYADDTQL